MKWLLAAALFFALAADAQAAPPVCSNVAVSTSHATAKSINPNCVGGNANPAVVTAPVHGTVTLAGGAFEYTPVTGFAGPDSFTYRTSNGDGPSNTATVSITVTVPVPICAGTSGSFGAGRGKTVNLLCGSQVAQEFAIVAAPAHGTLNTFDSASGTVIYRPDDAFAGTDSFTYKSKNPQGESNVATATLSVTGRPVVSSVASASSAQAAVSPRFDPQASTIEFRLYSTPCTGTPLFASTVPVGPDGTATSGTFNAPAGATSYWQATYSGDANNLGAVGPCDPVTIPAPQPAPGPEPLPTVDPEPAIKLNPSCGDRV